MGWVAFFRGGSCYSCLPALNGPCCALGCVVPSPCSPSCSLHFPLNAPHPPTRHAHAHAHAQVSLASDFVWNLNSTEASASFGYDYVLRQCRLRGRIDTGARAQGRPPACWPARAWGRRRRSSSPSRRSPPRRRPVPADGKIAAFLEERLNVGVNFVLSAEGGRRVLASACRPTPAERRGLCTAMHCRTRAAPSTPASLCHPHPRSGPPTQGLQVWVWPDGGRVGRHRLRPAPEASPAAAAACPRVRSLAHAPSAHADPPPPLHPLHCSSARVMCCAPCKAAACVAGAGDHPGAAGRDT